MILPKLDKELPYVIHKHSDGVDTEYQISIQTKEDELEFINIPKIGNVDTLSDSPTVGEYFGKFSEDTRTLNWLNYEGVTKSGNTYDIIDKGVVKIGDQTEKHSDLYFKGNLLSDRWILRRIPNIFDKSLFGEDKEALLLWKPAQQRSFEHSKNSEFETINCACPIADASAKFHEAIKQEGQDLLTRYNSLLSFNSDRQTFSGIAAAVGTVTDLFGNRYTYTPEFLTHLYNQQKEMIANGQIHIVAQDHSYTIEPTNTIVGQITDVKLVHEPLNHIIVNGIYNGPTELLAGEVGLSYELLFKSTWNPDFQSWIPFQATIQRLSVVNRPACKICWINKVN